MKDISVREYLARITKGELNAAAGGLLDNEYQRRLFALMVDYMPLLAGVDFITGLTGGTLELNDIELNDEAIRPWTSGTEPDADDLSDWTITPHVLTPGKGSIYVNITKDWLRKNIQGESAATLIEGLVARGWAKGIVNLGWNGNTAYTNADAGKQRFYRLTNGWLKLFSLDSAVTKFDTNGSTDLEGVVFPGLIEAAPEDMLMFQGADTPTIYLSAANARTYARLVGARKGTVRSDAAALDGVLDPFAGFPIKGQPHLADDTFVFTRPSNLVAGVWEELTMEREYKPRLHRLEITLDTEYGYGYKKSEHIVWGKNHS